MLFSERRNDPLIVPGGDLSSFKLIGHPGRHIRVESQRNYFLASNGMIKTQMLNG